LSYAIEKHRPGIARGTEYVQVAEDKIIGSTHWLDTAGRGRDSYHVITFGDGQITDMQGCRSRREAERYARRR
jgi:hypothetical protein